MSSVNSQGTPWMVTKLRAIFKQRYGSIDSSIRGYLGNNLAEMGMVAFKLEWNAVPIFPPNNLKDLSTKGHGEATLSQNTLSIPAKNNLDTGGIVSRFLYHLLHNFSTSVLSLPDSLIYDDLNHLSQRVYWMDQGGWQGDLPIIQTGLVFLNLVLVATGLGYSWIHHRWVGMVPMIFFIAYSASLSAAMNSGGRYLTPMDWVIYFYYGLAIVMIARFVYRGLAGKNPSQSVCKDSGVERTISDWRKLGFSLAGIICLASLIPIANFVLPVLTASTRNQEVVAVKKFVSMHEEPGTSIIYGEILYPYNEDSILTFDFLTPLGATSYRIVRTPELKAELSGGEHALIALRSNDQGKPQVESIYLWQDANPVLIWKHQP
jgi:hypothetical protein